MATDAQDDDSWLYGGAFCGIMLIFFSLTLLPENSVLCILDLGLVIICLPYYLP